MNMKNLRLLFLTACFIIAGSMGITASATPPKPVLIITDAQLSDTIKKYEITFVSLDNSDTLFTYVYTAAIQGELDAAFQVMKSTPNIGVGYSGAQNLDASTLTYWDDAVRVALDPNMGIFAGGINGNEVITTKDGVTLYSGGQRNETAISQFYEGNKTSTNDIIGSGDIVSYEYINGVLTPIDSLTNYWQVCSLYNLTVVCYEGAVTPAVTSVSVSPATINVVKGATAQFNATVTGTNNPAQTVTWSVSGRNSTATFISASGLLTVAPNETATTLTVTATSTVDATKSGTATVTVVTPFVPVTNIADVPTTTVAGTPLTLTGMVLPDNATNKTIVWSIKNAGTTGAGISTGVSYEYINGILTPVTSISITTQAEGTLILTATVKNGAATGTDYTQDFTITVTAPPAPAAYALSIGAFTGGKVTADTLSAAEGATILLTAVPDPGYQLNSISAYKTGDPATAVALTGFQSLTALTGTLVMPAFDVTVIATFSKSFIPVTDITGIPTTITAGEPLALTGLVLPDNATNKTIVWSIKDAGTTGAGISTGVSYEYINGILTPVTSISITTQAKGTLILTATVKNGAATGTDYTQDFTITVTAPPAPAAYALSIGAFTGGKVTADTLSATEGTTILLTAIPDPGYQLNSISAYKTGDPATAVALTGFNSLNALNGSLVMPAFDVTVIATFSSTSSFIPVINISGVPATLKAGEGIGLYISYNDSTATALRALGPIVPKPNNILGIVEPSNATNQYIVWTIKDAGTTGAEINPNVTYEYINGIITDVYTYYLFTQAAGTLILTATIKDGKAIGTNYVQDFTITVTPAEIPVTSISIDPVTAELIIGETQQLTATVAPSDATNQNVSWSSSNEAVATVSNTGLITAKSKGSATITATTEDGGFHASCTVNVLPQNVVAQDTTVAGSDGTGKIVLTLTIPADVLFSGTFILTLPNGVKLDLSTTHLSGDLATALTLTIVQQADGSWLFNITPQTAMRSATELVYSQIMEIGYTVDKTVAPGTYEAIISDLSFTFNNNTSVTESKLPVKLTVKSMTGIPGLCAETGAYMYNGRLYVSSPVAEKIQVYSVAGTLLYNFQKPAGKADYIISDAQGSVLIVKGNSGWVKKVIR